MNEDPLEQNNEEDYFRELESKLEHSIGILDTNVIDFHPNFSLTNILYDGIDGLNALTPEIINRCRARLERIANLPTERVIIIPQVVAEKDAMLQILNRQTSYIQKELGKDPLAEEEIEEHEETLDILRDYNLDLLGLIRDFRKRPQPKLAPLHKDYYERILSLAMLRSEDLDRESLEKKERTMSHPRLLKFDAKTDHHICATAITLAYQSPTLIVSNDEGVTELALRILSEIKETKYNSKVRNNLGIWTLPKHKIELHALDHPSWSRYLNPVLYDPSEQIESRKLARI